MTTLRKEIQPLLEEFAKANGKGNVTNGNLALIKMVDLLVTHIEKQSWASSFVPTSNYTAAAPQGPAYTTIYTSDYVYHPANAAPIAANAGLAVAAFPGAMLPWGPLPAEAQMAALETLHKANYVLDPDYTAIKEHIALPGDEKAAMKAQEPDMKPARKKPGRKPKIIDPDAKTAETPRRRDRKPANG